ncbi:RagB/SusD family nutrient uptake outer membrane protein [Dysgonomonadaceae bacterium zrk40]|nr:RagB/SusD family nutrient uptake outer membrane protein [Dysgonomonadaceae bacterium zrk40]
MKIKTYIIYPFALLMISIGMLQSCSLDEDVYSEYVAETYYQGETQILSSLSGIYRNFATITGMGVEYRCMECPADQVLVTGKIQGWWSGDNYEQLTEHKWDADHSYLGTSWNSFFGTVGRTNALLASLERSGIEGLEAPKAELRALRAYAYFFLMDFFGNVPIFTEEKVNPKDLPKQNTRSEVFDFVIKELEAAAPDLPSQNDVGSDYYGRLTREAVYALMAVIYMNGEIYTGTPYNDDVITYCDLVINSGAYEMLDNYFDNFVHNNEENSEFIFGGVYTPKIPGGVGHPLVQKVLPGISGGLFGLPYTPQNGFQTRESVYNLFEDEDIRKRMFLGHGPLIDPRNGDVVMVERVVPDGNSVLYVEGKSAIGPVPYEIIPATGIRNQPMNAGIKWIKWGLDPNTNGGNAGNDIAFLRYSEMFLLKAEAYARKGQFDKALPLVNLIRQRSNATPMESVTLDDILDERGRELTFEMQRRRDLIRFGKFTSSWEFKDASEEFRNIFPIPQSALDANPNLKQNTGYN